MLSPQSLHCNSTFDRREQSQISTSMLAEPRVEELHSLLVVAPAGIDFVDIAVLEEGLRIQYFDHNLLAVAHTVAVVDCSPLAAGSLRKLVDCILPVADIHLVGNRHMLNIDK